jgi:hypothetical protein
MSDRVVVYRDEAARHAALTELERRDLEQKAALAADEPIYLTSEDVTKPDPARKEPTIEAIARKAAELVLEIQKNSPSIVEDAPPPAKPRKVRKTVIRDENNRISEVIEEEM